MQAKALWLTLDQLCISTSEAGGGDNGGCDGLARSEAVPKLTTPTQREEEVEEERTYLLMDRPASARAFPPPPCSTPVRVVAHMPFAGRRSVGANPRHNESADAGGDDEGDGDDGQGYTSGEEGEETDGEEGGETDEDEEEY